MTLTQIKVFIEVVQLKNFTRVGEKLGMTQSAVSHAILALESHLDVKLINRSRNGLTLTSNGENVYKKMVLINDNVNSIYNEIIPEVKLSKRSVRIGTLPSTSVSIVPKLLSEFNKKYPQVDISLLEGTDDEILNWIKSDTVDLGFISQDIESLYTKFIIQDEMKAILSSTHSLSTSNSISIKSLKNEHFIMSTSGCEPLIRHIFRKNKLEPHVSFRVNSIPTLIEMVKENIGVSIIPELYLSSVSSSILLQKPLKQREYRKLYIASSQSIEDDILKSTILKVIKVVAKSYNT